MTNKNNCFAIYTKDVIILNKELYDNKTFEEIKHIDENGIEYWYARELMPILQYAK